jgi:hypothetical protein
MLDMNLQNVSKSFNGIKLPATPKGAAGYDNARENIDPHVKSKVVNTIEGIFRKIQLIGKTAGSILFLDGNNRIEEDNTNFFYDNTNKRIGIKTNAPAAHIEIDSQSGASDLLRFRTGRAWKFRTTSSGATTDLQLMTETDNKSFKIMGSNGTTRAADFVPNTTAGGTRVYLAPDGGKVGIANTSPNEALDVTGTIRASVAYNIAGSVGVSGSFTTVDLKTVTVTKGIITSIV